MTYLLDNVWILWGEVTYQSFLGVKRLIGVRLSLLAISKYLPDTRVFLNSA